MRPARLLVPLLVAAQVGLVGCAGGAGGAPDAGRLPTSRADATAAGADDLTGDLVVFAAASLQETFGTLGDTFMARHPAVTVTFNFASSSALAQQILAGAPADVFAAASASTMEAASEATDAPAVFARNTLEIAVPPDNPGGIVDLADLADPDRTIALCAVEVPCGAAAQQAFDAAGLTPAPDTYEADVKAALSKVMLGEVDAALVYRTDVVAAGDRVRGIPFPPAAQATTDDLIATLRDAPNPRAAQAFVALVTSAEGRAVLTDAGFGGP